MRTLLTRFEISAESNSSRNFAVFRGETKSAFASVAFADDECFARRRRVDFLDRR